MSRSLAVLSALALTVSMAALIWMIGTVVAQGMPYLSPGAVAGSESVAPPSGALFGSLRVVGLALIPAVVLGIAIGAVISERRRDSRLGRLCDVGVTILAESPPIGFGLIAFWVLDRLLGRSDPTLAAAATLCLLAAPLAAAAARRCFLAVPRSVRTAAAALGASRVDVFRYCVLPRSRPRLIDEMGGVAARMLGEAAPLLVVIGWTGSAAGSGVRTLPTEIFSLATTDGTEAVGRAAAAIVMLLALLALIRATGAGVSRWAQRRIREEYP